MTDPLHDTTPLGRSVEDIERESGNLTNDPREGESMRRDETAVIPAVANANTTGMIAAVAPTDLIEKGSGPDDGTGTVNRDSSEE
ncbi:hypothetical protein GCM10008959_13850 [Deinococcus seoulensis]|uniref:Uncharacterized protein n=1 Tax=Deinococcus seoulensis TaxID=1837379 RepID=A0ABQ2RSJ7_9DEIO|nr:hypothetical protein [Deinococcus seoulensis]GGR53469.1 hypothetical protein GCM10008959_13850 [Deinococcus seoulensis]